MVFAAVIDAIVAATDKVAVNDLERVARAMAETNLLIPFSSILSTAAGFGLCDDLRGPKGRRIRHLGAPARFSNRLRQRTQKHSKAAQMKSSCIGQPGGPATQEGLLQCSN